MFTFKQHVLLLQIKPQAQVLHSHRSDKKVSLAFYALLDAKDWDNSIFRNHLFWLQVPLSSFHRNELICASKLKLEDLTPSLKEEV